MNNRRALTSLHLRTATSADVPQLADLIERSARTLCSRAYNERQMRSWMEHVFKVDHTLIEDGTYCVAELDGKLVGAGGWSRRQRRFQGEAGTDSSALAEALAQPSQDPARIRMFFIDPAWTRCGIARRILEECERQARAAGFHRFELMATLTGEALYTACGYQVMERAELRLPDGVLVEGVRMIKEPGFPKRTTPEIRSDFEG